MKLTEHRRTTQGLADLLLYSTMVAGGTLVFGGELSEFARRSCVAALAIAFLVLGAGFMTALFGVGGATVL